MTEYRYIVQIITGDCAEGNALAESIFGDGAAGSFSDENSMRLTKNGAPAWGSEFVTIESEYQAALAIGGDLMRCGGREIQYTLRDFAAAKGYTIAEAG